MVRYMFSKSVIILVVFFAISGLVGAYVYFQPEVSPYEFGRAERRDVVDEISVTGRVAPAQTVNLAFEGVGKITTIAVKVGDHVLRGALLVAQDQKELASQLLEAEAAFNVKQAELAELKRGARPEEIRVDEVTVENKRVALEDARRDLANKIRDAFTKSDDAVRNYIDQLYTNARISPKLDKFNITDSALRRELETKRGNIEIILKDWSLAVAVTPSGETILDDAVYAKTQLGAVMAFLDRAAFMVNGLEENANLTKTILSGYKVDVATARTNVNTATVNLSAAEEKVRTARSALLLAEEELTFLQVGATQENLAAKNAALDQARAKIATIEAQLAKKTIYAPIAGVVTAVGPEMGEIVAANSIIVSVISSGFSAGGGSASSWEIDANVPEVDIAKVQLGKEAQVTLDAYGREHVFMASVMKLNPAETIIEGVTTYRVTLQFVTNDNRVRSGMTANITIISDERIGVVAVPRRAIISRNGNKILRVRRNGVVEEISVGTGLYSSDGYVEITDGVGEGEEVVVFVKE